MQMNTSYKKKKGTDAHKIRINLTNMLSHGNQIQKSTYYMITFTGSSRTGKLLDYGRR